MKEITKLPWHQVKEVPTLIVGEKKKNGSWEYVTDTGEVADPRARAANAAYIVQACNAFPLMVQALKDAETEILWLLSQAKYSGPAPANLNSVRAALAAAKGEGL